MQITRKIVNGVLQSILQTEDKKGDKKNPGQGAGSMIMEQTLLVDTIFLRLFAVNVLHLFLFLLVLPALLILLASQRRSGMQTHTASRRIC
jgi:hypothetical protein